MFIFLDIWTKNYFVRDNQKKVHFFHEILIFSVIFSKRSQIKIYFLRNIDINVIMGFSELGGHSKTLTCFGGALKYKG